MLGLIIWCILIIIIAVCITPWWFLPSVIIVSIINEFLFGKKCY
jgi:hypothetical protein